MRPRKFNLYQIILRIIIYHRITYVIISHLNSSKPLLLSFRSPLVCISFIFIIGALKLHIYLKLTYFLLSIGLLIGTGEYPNKSLQNHSCSKAISVAYLNNFYLLSIMFQDDNSMYESNYIGNC